MRDDHGAMPIACGRVSQPGPPRSCSFVDQNRCGRRSKSAPSFIESPFTATPTSDMRIVWATNGNKELNVREILEGGPRDLYLTILAEAGIVM